MQQPSVNRYLADKAMDHIDHALGRPADPMAPTYRNHFVIDRESDIARQFSASNHWHVARSAPDDGMLCFFVTDEGRAALAAHLKAIGDKHRVYRVWLGDDEMSPVVATTAAKARYLKFLQFDDGMTFGEFCRASRVRIADGNVTA